MTITKPVFYMNERRKKSCQALTFAKDISTGPDKLEVGKRLSPPLCPLCSALFKRFCLFLNQKKHKHIMSVPGKRELRSQHCVIITSLKLICRTEREEENPLKFHGSGGQLHSPGQYSLSQVVFLSSHSPTSNASCK